MATKRAAQYIAKTQAAKSNQGGYTPGKGRNANGKCGEWQARRDLEDQGYDVISVQNKSGHGIDVAGRNPKTGEVRVLEVKTTQTDVAPPLTGAGKSMGGERFTESRLGQALGEKGHWQNQPEVKANTEKLGEWLKDAKRRGANVNYEKYDVFVDDPDKGCIKRKDSKSSPWEAPADKGSLRVLPSPLGRVADDRNRAIERNTRWNTARNVLTSSSNRSAGTRLGGMNAIPQWRPSGINPTTS